MRSPARDARLFERGEREHELGARHAVDRDGAPRARAPRSRAPPARRAAAARARRARACAGRPRAGAAASASGAEQHEPLRQRAGAGGRGERRERGRALARRRVGHARHAGARERARRRARGRAAPRGRADRAATRRAGTGARRAARASRSTPGVSTPASRPSARQAAEFSIQSAPPRCWMRSGVRGTQRRGARGRGRRRRTRGSRRRAASRRPRPRRAQRRRERARVVAHVGRPARQRRQRRRSEQVEVVVVQARQQRAAPPFDHGAPAAASRPGPSAAMRPASMRTSTRCARDLGVADQRCQRARHLARRGRSERRPRRGRRRRAAPHEEVQRLPGCARVGGGGSSHGSPLALRARATRPGSRPAGARGARSSDPTSNGRARSGPPRAARCGGRTCRARDPDAEHRMAPAIGRRFVDAQHSGAGVGRRRQQRRNLQQRARSDGPHRRSREGEGDEERHVAEAGAEEQIRCGTAEPSGCGGRGGVHAATCSVSGHARVNVASVVAPGDSR